MNFRQFVARALLCAFVPSACLSAAYPDACKAIPGSLDWPSNSEWMKLNSSLSGKLLAPTPPGAVCHTDQATFDSATCATVAKDWISSLYHAQQPISIDYNDDICYPDRKAPCSAEGYPPYVINASCAADVKQGVDFARQHNIRLTVKGTGHDYNGRSSAPYSLSIWTRHLQKLQFFDSFTPRDCSACDSSPAAKIYAGLQWRDVQKAAARRKVMIVGGADPDVGLGGYLTGGGHSPISSKFGLAADQALEFEVVTAGGEILTVNQCNHEDLFWALRGGGPSFAVIISATVKTYPTVPLSLYIFEFNTTGNSDTFWESNAYFHSQLPRLSDGGLMGYYVTFAHSPGEPNKEKRGKISGIFLGLNKSTSEASALFQPINKFFDSNPYPDKVFRTEYSAQLPDFYSFFSTVVPETVGTDGRLGSRLLGRHALTSNRTALVQALKTASAAPNLIIGHLVAGKGVGNAKPAGGDDAVNPAWRHAYTHVVVPIGWPLLDEKEKAEKTRELTNKQIAALRDLAPDSGAYVNEADPDEPNWQEAFWGSHYSRLLSIKEKWDPEGVFYCFPCVGAEKWKLVDNRLCRA